MERSGTAGTIPEHELTGQMQPIGEMLRRMRERVEQVRQQTLTRHRELITEGHALWGWPLDAACHNCGDTGKWPNSIHYCTCAAATELEQRDKAFSVQVRRETNWRWSGVPRRFDAFRISTAPNERAATEVSAWIDNRAWSRRGENLFLFGPVGTGKTGLAIGALWEINELSAGSVAFWSAPDLFDQMRPGAPEPDPMARAKRVGILVLDDLGVEKASDWVRERLYVLIDARYGDELPTIVTSNRGLPSLAETLGDRIVSRLGECMTPVFVDGADQRRL